MRTNFIAISMLAVLSSAEAKDSLEVPTSLYYICFDTLNTDLPQTISSIVDYIISAINAVMHTGSHNFMQFVRRRSTTRRLARCQRLVIEFHDSNIAVFTSVNHGRGM